MMGNGYLLWMGQRNPNHQLIGGKHPIVYRVSTIRGLWEMGYESGQLYDIHVFWLMKQREMGNPIFCLVNCTGTLFFFFKVPLNMKTMGTNGSV